MQTDGAIDPSPGHGPGLMGVDTLVGNDVDNHKDEDIGEKLFAVPWEALTLDTANKRFVLNVEKDGLDKAPGFDKDHWPDMADPIWAANIHAYYGTTPLLETRN